MKIKLFMLVVFITTLPGCAGITFNTETLKSSKNYDVWLDPKPSQNTIKIKSKSQGWKKKNRKDGYVGYAKGQSGTTFFSVDTRNIGASCEAKTAEWVISLFRVSVKGDITTEKGTDFGAIQPAWLKEAFPNVNLSNGVIYEADGNKGVTFLPVYNANAQKAEELIYYEVTLTNCEDLSTLKTDPVLRNGGKQ